MPFKSLSKVYPTVWLPIICAVVLSLSSCKQEGFLGCDNIFVCNINGTEFTGDLFFNELVRTVDPVSGVGGKILILDVVDPEGRTFYLEIADYSNGTFGDCISVESFYANPLLNPCVNLGAFPFCNNYTARYNDDGIEHVTTELDGQLDIISCDPGRITATFSFQMENLNTGNFVNVVAGTFSVCYLAR